MESKKHHMSQSIILWLIGIYLIIPLFLTLLYSLFSEWITVVPNGFSFNGYTEILTDFNFWASIGRTIIISVVPIVICTVIILLAMYVVVVYMPRLDKIIKVICKIPLI